MKDLLFPHNAVDYPHLDLPMMHVSDLLREVQKQLVQRRKIQGYIVLLSVVLPSAAIWGGFGGYLCVLAAVWGGWGCLGMGGVTWVCGCV